MKNIAIKFPLGLVCKRNKIFLNYIKMNFEKKLWLKSIFQFLSNDGKKIIAFDANTFFVFLRAQEKEFLFSYHARSMLKEKVSNHEKILSL